MSLHLLTQRQKFDRFDYLQGNSGFRNVTVDTITINQKILTATSVKLCVLNSGLGSTCTESAECTRSLWLALLETCWNVGFVATLSWDKPVFLGVIYHGRDGTFYS